MFEVDAERKQILWLDAETKVKQDLDAMPDQHRAHLSEIALSWFPEVVSEIKLTREKFSLSKELCEAGRLSERFVVLNRRLFRDVSLFLLGVAPKKDPSLIPERELGLTSVCDN